MINIHFKGDLKITEEVKERKPEQLRLIEVTLLIIHSSHYYFKESSSNSKCRSDWD